MLGANRREGGGVAALKGAAMAREKISEAELRRLLEAWRTDIVRRELLTEGQASKQVERILDTTRRIVVSPDGRTRRTVVNQDAARRIVAAYRATMAAAKPRILQGMVKAQTRDVAQLTGKWAEGMKDAALLPTGESPPRLPSKHPGGRPAAPIRDAVVAAMVAFKRQNSEADQAAVFNHIRAKFPRKSAWAYTTLLRYYERAERILTETR